MIGGVTTIGIIGGGQLGRMLTLAAKPLGFEVVVVDPGDNVPAAQVGAKHIKADLYDRAALQKLAEMADVITIEIEHLDADALAAIAELGKPVHPAPSTIKMIQDKFRQKEFFNKAKVPLTSFVSIDGAESARDALKKFKKMLIKTRLGAFDGRGNMLVRNKEDIVEALKKFAGQKLYAEKFVPFKKELAVVVAKSTNGEIAIYPTVETIHRRNICLEVRAPAEISAKAKRNATSLAKKVAANLQGAGVFAIEMFLTKDDKVLLNEIAPRVHNSGHYSIEGAATSQFEQHIRAVSGLPLGRTKLMHPAAVMINILGERNGDTEITGLNEALKIPHVSVHLYGKSPTKIDRKMGHITALGSSLAQARSRANSARKALSI